MFKGAKKTTRVHVSAALAAMFLAACGGGGGGGDPLPADPVAGAPAPAPAPATPLAWNATSLAANTWHWVTMNPAGNIQAAAAIPGSVFLSSDSGATWRDSGLPTDNWISVDMSEDGQRMAAVGFGGGMYLSTDGGNTWTKADTAFNPALPGDPGGDLAYESVTMSQDGQRLVAVVMNGPAYFSTDGGATFATAGGSAAAAAPWRAVDSSADGMVVAAAAQDGNVHLSTDGGATFAALPVDIGAGPINDGWYRLAMSEDGNTIAVAGNPDFAGTSSGIYVTRDRGVTWTQGHASTGSYTTLDMSQDGGIIVGTMSGASGTVLLSTNGGQSFSSLGTLPAGETNWRSIAIDENATDLLLAAGTFFGATGQLYTSTGTIAP